MSTGTRSAPAVAGPGRPVARPRGAPRAVVVILAAGALLALVTSLVATALAPRPAVGAGSVVAVVGDSFSSGTAQGGWGGSNWTALLAATRDWRVTDDAIPGTGYLAARPGTAPYGSAQLDRALAVRPDLVVVQGSVNDGELPPEQVGAAATELYRAIRARAPAARLVVIGPAWPGDTPSAALLGVRDAIGGAARAAGATWIDPMTEQWFAGAQPVALIGADGLHPTDAGHRLMAERTADALARDGL